MKVAVLASGSKGNATVVELDGVRFLVDAGISARRLEKALAEVGMPAETLAGVLLTHEHVDHIGGLRVFLKHWPRLKVWTRPGTIREAMSQLKLTEEAFVPLTEEQTLGESTLRLRSFVIPHDAADPCGFVVTGSERYVHVTDLGFVTDTVQRELEEADSMVLETNHDLAMLQQGRYPLMLKKRILGSRGHLSNRAAANALSQLDRLPKELFLGHLSEENNLPELAERTLREMLAEAGRDLSRMSLKVTSQECITM